MQVKPERGVAASAVSRFEGEFLRGQQTQEGSGSSCGSPRSSRVEFLQGTRLERARRLGKREKP
jgi:hypothetical protein